MEKSERKNYLRESREVSYISLALLIISYIVISSIRFSFYLLSIMLIVSLLNFSIYFYMRYKIHARYHKNIDIQGYILEDNSWRYVLSLSVLLTIFIFLEYPFPFIRFYSFILIVNAFVITTWIVSLNGPIIGMLISRSDPLYEPFLYRAMELANAMNINVPDLYILDTRNRIANAFTVSRKESYVFITRLLMNILDVDEVTAVMAHEFAHIKLRHNLKTSIINFAVILFLINIALYGLTLDSFAGIMLPVISIIIYMFFTTFLLNYIKRRNEINADLTAIKYVNPDYLISALHKIENLEIFSRRISDIYLDHPSIDRRISIINRSRSS
ncbi:M48 family metallopeptidase [Picrophilus oshimae]|nr:M56 family metallopeptidase [Picrophilus oshimae]SMD30410.1 STE24 endopeptidase [Picrophilus oshimae DSM 9789]